MAQTLGLQFGLMIESSAHERSGRSQALLPNLILAFLILPLSFTIKEHRTRRESASVVATSNVPALMYTSSKPASMEDDDDRGSDHAEASNSGRRPSDDVETSPLLPKPAFEIHKLSALLLLRSTRFMTASIALSLLTGIQYGIIWVLPSQISSTFHLAPLQTAALFLVMILPVFLAPISGTLTDRFGAKWPAASGLIIVIPTLILLGLFGPETSMPLSKLAILLFLLGVSFMLSMPPFRAEAAKVVDGIEGSIPGASQPNRAYAKAYGLMNAFVAGGMVAGLLYMHFVCASLGWCFTSISLGLMSLVILLPVFLFVGSGSSSFEGPTIEVTQHA
ncbi:uncharacterized protein KY384_005565 [Bacidia gigantensis]|uniref:uncharacterized protein n=1 Tax=Bacidia gigantensis TaxID=2732470 RepID=UPI001D044AD3|nr:uncharacterized protein KY384_005565 [Bacidia gigantensis]KAG8530083.1 hypothetical protein KY384_005565 [Bacidia gigantensis]